MWKLSFQKNSKNIKYKEKKVAKKYLHPNPFSSNNIGLITLVG